MKLCTASETLSFIRGQEEQAAKFYMDLAKRYPQEAAAFEAFAKDNAKYNTMVQRSYQSVITDAIEGCYAFELESEEFLFDSDLAAGASLSQAAQKALEIENVIIGLYNKAADQSMSLLADVPRMFKIVVKKRSDRLEKLKSLA